MTWGVDFTTNARADLVGLDPDVSDALTDVLVAWTHAGPPRTGRRELGGFVFYESPVGGRHLLGYVVNSEAKTLMVLWLRRRPGVHA